MPENGVFLCSFLVVCYTVVGDLELVMGCTVQEPLGEHVAPSRWDNPLRGPLALAWWHHC